MKKNNVDLKKVLNKVQSEIKKLERHPIKHKEYLATLRERKEFEKNLKMDIAKLESKKVKLEKKRSSNRIKSLLNRKEYLESEIKRSPGIEQEKLHLEIIYLRKLLKEKENQEQELCNKFNKIFEERDLILQELERCVCVSCKKEKPMNKMVAFIGGLPKVGLPVCSKKCYYQVIEKFELREKALAKVNPNLSNIEISKLALEQIKQVRNQTFWN